MSPADRHGLLDAIEDEALRTVRLPGEPGDPGERHQCIAVHAQEALAELRFQFAQALVEEQAAARVERAHVLLVGEQCAYLADLDQARVAADAAAEATASASELACQSTQLVARGGACGGERCIELLALHGFQQVGHRAGLEGRDRVLLEGRAEHDGRRMLLGHEVARRLDAIHARHADVEQNEVRLEGPRDRDRLTTVGGLAAGLRRHAPGEQAAEPLACERFVVDDQHFHRGPPAGMRSVARKLSPSRAVSRAAASP